MNRFGRKLLRANYMKLYNRIHVDELKKRGLCTRCGQMESLKNDTRCIKCRSKTRARKRNRHYKLRNEALKAYGSRCACPGCNVTESTMLTFDHINNDGKNRYKQENKVGLCMWLKKNHFPSDFQILCWNCNESKRINKGECSHVLEYEAKKLLETMEQKT